MKGYTRGAALAVAVAGLFLAKSAAAQGSAEPTKAQASAKCYGVNKCKGMGACGGKGHSCAGQNACKGQGYLELDKETCLKIEGGRLTAAAQGQKD